MGTSDGAVSDIASIIVLPSLVTYPFVFTCVLSCFKCFAHSDLYMRQALDGPQREKNLVRRLIPLAPNLGNCHQPHVTLNQVLNRYSNFTRHYRCLFLAR